MPILTLTTDFGLHSHFVAELKGKIAAILPDYSIIDITHSIAPFKLIETAFILKNSIFHFPTDTIHAVGVDSSLDFHKAIIIAKNRGQYMVAADNGIVPMVFDDDAYVYKRIEAPDNDYFSFKNSFPQYIRQLTDHNFEIKKMPGKQEGINEMTMQKPVFDGDNIAFNIICFDAFGNAYTNLTRQFFIDVVGKREFKINLGRFDWVEKIHTKYTDVPESEKVCFFDENGYMVIAINRGRADQLLGLKRESNQLVIEVF